MLPIAGAASAEQVARLVGIEGPALAKGGKATEKAAKGAAASLHALQAALEAEQLQLAQLLTAGLAEMASILQQPFGDAAKPTLEELRLELMRRQGALSIGLPPDVVFSVLQSEAPVADLRLLHPQLSSSCAADFCALSTALQFRGCLLRHVGRALRMAILLRQKLEALPRVPKAELADQCLVLGQDADSLAAALTAEHHVVSRRTRLFNPLYATFQFSCGFSLRRRQVGLMEERLITLDGT